jgi:type IV secretory pathway VirB4 component
MINARPTQDFVPIKEVRDGYLILKDGSMRAIVMTSSLNFALKSAEEQTSILYQFQSFLNSLDFTIQIFVESRKLDIRPYLALLEEQYKEQLSDLMKIQIQEYIEFVKNFTENTNIMTKSFFIVIPYSPAILQNKSDIIGKINPLGKKATVEEKVRSAAEEFEENRMQLEERVSVVEQGLVRCGIRTVQLGSEEIIELFYKLFNPGDTEKPLKTA